MSLWLSPTLENAFRNRSIRPTNVVLNPFVSNSLPYFYIPPQWDTTLEPAIAPCYQILLPASQDLCYWALFSLSRWLPTTLSFWDRPVWSAPSLAQALLIPEPSTRALACTACPSFKAQSKF